MRCNSTIDNSIDTTNIYIYILCRRRCFLHIRGSESHTRAEESVRRQLAESVARGPRHVLGGVEAGERGRDRSLGRRAVRPRRRRCQLQEPREEGRREECRHQVPAAVPSQVFLPCSSVGCAGLLVPQVPQQNSSRAGEGIEPWCRYICR